MHPLQRDCDPNNPAQHAAWCWAAGIPDPSPVRPVPIPLIGPMLVESVSRLLWDFGFRWHADLQTKWIEGSAGLGTVAKLSDDKPAESGEDLMTAAWDFLMENNPELLASINNSDDSGKKELLSKLEKNFKDLQSLISTLRKEM
ncbi:MAG: hypothetical protein ACKODT_08085 [Fluviibacter sp.]